MGGVEVVKTEIETMTTNLMRDLLGGAMLVATALLYVSIAGAPMGEAAPAFQAQVEAAAEAVLEEAPAAEMPIAGEIDADASVADCT
ncbi:MAG: hypothetical protein D6701_00790 [Gemmatimonadetes bacterium]|nr:MAG: hypothetical protein D6701_00790 [Gemmatimonadota bacterium]